MVDLGGFHHEPARATASVLLNYPTEQHREATRRVGEGGLFAKVQLLAVGRVANAGHEASLAMPMPTTHLSGAVGKGSEAIRKQ